MAIASIFDSISKLRLGILLLGSAALLQSCTQPSVEVRQSPLRSEVRYLGKDFEGKDPELVLEADQQAVTLWDFGCQNNFEFDVVDESQLSTGIKSLRLRINKVVISLSAPVVIWLPEKAAPDVVAHERGHETICRRIYQSSIKTARRAAESVIGRTFEGEGKTRDEACALALAKAQEYVCHLYHSETAQDVNAVSDIYDALDQNEKGQSDALVNKAFAGYKRISSGAQK